MIRKLELFALPQPLGRGEEDELKVESVVGGMGNPFSTLNLVPGIQIWVNRYLKFIDIYLLFLVNSRTLK